MEMLTTEPGVQFYTGNFLDGKLKGKGGRRLPEARGFCLEAQHFPDSVHHANFPRSSSSRARPTRRRRSTVLRPGDGREGAGEATPARAEVGHAFSGRGRPHARVLP